MLSTFGVVEKRTLGGPCSRGGGGHSHMPCSHDCSQSGVNGLNKFLAASQQSKYPTTVTLTMKISLTPRFLSRFLRQHNQCCIVAVPVG